MSKIKYDLTILQLATNDLKMLSPDRVVEDMKHLVSTIQHSQPTCKIALSLAPLQRNYDDMNAKINIVNTSLKMFYNHNDNVCTYHNDNFRRLPCLGRSTSE